MFTEYDQLEHQTHHKCGDKAEYKAAYHTFNGLFGADVGAQLMLSERRTDEVSASVRHPRQQKQHNKEK